MNIKTPCKALQMSDIKKITLSGAMKAIASTLHVTPITMNRRKYKEKLNRKIGRTENETEISHAHIRL